MTTTELINGIVSFVNRDVIDDPDVCEALLSFDDRAVPAPLTKFYFAFLIGQDKVDLQNVDTVDCCQRTQITVSMNCYAPPGESAIGVCAYAENVLDQINIQYAGMMGGYEIGTAVIDDYLKALKIPCKLHFQYEQCPAYDVSGTVLLPYADFLCKTHVNDNSVHLSPADRARISTPFICGTYTGLGAYNPATVTLGFRPTVVFVYPLNDVAVKLNTSYNTLMNFSDCAVSGFSNSYIQITNTGFSVSAADAMQSNTSMRTLNETGVVYGYIAVK